MAAHTQITTTRCIRSAAAAGPDLRRDQRMHNASRKIREHTVRIPHSQHNSYRVRGSHTQHNTTHASSHENENTQRTQCCANAIARAVAVLVVAVQCMPTIRRTHARDAASERERETDYGSAICSWQTLHSMRMPRRTHDQAPLSTLELKQRNWIRSAWNSVCSAHPFKLTQSYSVDPSLWCRCPCMWLNCCMTCTMPFHTWWLHPPKIQPWIIIAIHFLIGFKYCQLCLYEWQL